MRALTFFSLCSVLIAVACGGSSTESAAAGCTDDTTPNPAACPAELPSSYSSCSSQGTRCSYAEQGSTGPDGCKKAATVMCIIEGPDSGQPKSPSWWPQP